MSKKLLLLALPALMVMSSCTYMQSATKVELFKEDTVANEKVFGELQPMNLGVPNVDPGDDPTWTKAPKVGVQFKSYTESEVDYLAVRFVAAIADTDGMTATWSRAVSEKNSNQIKPMAHDKVSSVKYDALNNGGTPKAATSEGSGYNKYVVYSMYNIPASQDESYVAAYLTLSKDGETDVVSKVIATQLDGSYYFSFDAADLVKDGYFLQTTSGIVKQKADADTDPANDAKDNAFFENVNLVANEEFGLFRFTSSCFQFFGYDKFWNSNDEGDAENMHSSQSYVKAADLDQFGELYLNGKYDFYVNKYNFVFTAPKDVDVTFSFTPSEHWKEASAIFYLYGFNGEGDDGWVKFNETATAGVYSAHAEHWSFTKLIYVRKNPANDAGNWDGKWNQSGNIDVNFSNLSRAMGADEWWG